MHRAATSRLTAPTSRNSMPPKSSGCRSGRLRGKRGEKPPRSRHCDGHTGSRTPLALALGRRDPATALSQETCPEATARRRRGASGPVPRGVLRGAGRFDWGAGDAVIALSILVLSLVAGGAPPARI